MRHYIADNLTEGAPSAPAYAPNTPGVRWVLEYLAWLTIIFVLAAVFAVSVLSPAFAAIGATVKATKEKGFGRIVIDFTDMPKIRDEIAAGVFVLSFDQQIDVELDPVLDALPDYVGLVRRDPDGMALRFALKRPYQISIMEAGSELFVDLLPPGWKGLPPPLPAATIKALTEKAIQAERKAAEEAAQRKAAKIPYKLNVRLARHPTFTRIVFDWNKFVTANLARKGRSVELRFDKHVTADLSELRADPPRFLHAVNAAETQDGMVVQFTIDDDVDVRGFREGLDYVVDLTGSEALADASAAAIADQAGAKEAPGTVNESALPEGRTETAMLSGERKNPGPAITGKGGETTTVTKDIDPAVLSARSFAPGDGVAPGFTSKSGGHAADTLPGEGAPDKAATHSGAKQALETGELVSEGDETAKPSAGARAYVGPAVTTPASGKPANASPEAIETGLRFTFQFEEPVAAAVFRRGRSIWTVFDSDAQLDIARLRESAGSMVDDIQQVRFGDAQYIRIKLREPQIAHVNYANNGWHLIVGDMAAGNTNPLQLVRTLRDDNRSLIKIAMKNYGRVHWLTDPEIGDRLAVVTALPPERSIAKPQELVDFSAFSTAHGIAIRPRTDDVAVRLHLDEVLITRREGLTLSAGNAGQYSAGKKPLRNSAHAGFIDFERWKISSPGELSDRIHELQRIIAQAPQNEMNARRFDLATLYTSNDFYAEALGLLHRMVSVDQDVELDPAFSVLRGATLILMDRLEEARRDFEIHALVNDADASLWRGLMAAKEQKWSDALRSFREGADRIESYRADMHARFRLAAVRAALEINKLSQAAAELNAVPRETLPKAIAANFNLLKARYLESVGREEEAVEAYQAALDSGVEPAVAEARLYATVLDLNAGRIERKEALKALERLQLFWRGDHIELRTLRALAGLYVQEKRYHDGFTVMRNSVESFPDNKLALKIQDDMQDVFKTLFLHGESESMDPVKALSLYYGNRELTPVGRLGDEMIRGLADRLVSVDLLDQAGELLDHQVNKRLKGAARAQVATRLAMVHLMNHKADLALRVIRRTRQAGLPEGLQKSRNLLEARALGELGRAAAAVEILSTMDGNAVERLKADVYWAGQDWKNAGVQIERMLAGRWRDPEALTDQERFYVLRAAIAYSLANDQFALDRLRKKYYPKLLKTPDADSFLLVTKPIKEKDVAFRNLAKEIAAIDTLDAFLKEFKEGYDRENGKRASTRKAGGHAG